MTCPHLTDVQANPAPEGYQFTPLIHRNSDERTRRVALATSHEFLRVYEVTKLKNLAHKKCRTKHSSCKSTFMCFYHGLLIINNPTNSGTRVGKESVCNIRQHYSLKWRPLIFNERASFFSRHPFYKAWQ